MCQNKPKFKIDTFKDAQDYANKVCDSLSIPEKAQYKEKSNGSTASYYELPKDAKELQDIISYKNMNSQIGEIFRACMRYGEVSHSPKLRDAKKISFYINEEIKRLERYEH